MTSEKNRFRHRFYHGMNRRDALFVARQCGCSIEYPPGTGEVLVSHVLMPDRVRANNRKKAASRALTSWGMKLERLLYDRDQAA